MKGSGYPEVNSISDIGRMAGAAGIHKEID